MTLKEFNDLYLGKAVHCETEELANEFLELADSFGYEWVTGDKLTKFSNWEIFKENTCYILFTDKKYIRYCHLDHALSKIIKFKGENKMTLKDLKQGMVCKLRNNEIITVLDNGYLFEWKFTILPFLGKYNEDLTHKENKLGDIIEVTYGDKVVFERKNASRWFVPKVEEGYYYINEFGGIISTINSQFSGDIDILNNNRVFKTKEEAEKRLKQQQATLSVERWIAENDVEVDLHDVDVEKFVVMYDIDTKKFVVGYYSFYVVMPKQFILSSEEKAKQLIKEREKELKIMFGVEE